MGLRPTIAQTTNGIEQTIGPKPRQMVCKPEESSSPTCITTTTAARHNRAEMTGAVVAAEAAEAAEAAMVEVEEVVSREGLLLHPNVAKYTSVIC